MAAPLAMSLSMQAFLPPSVGMHAPVITPRSAMLRMDEQPTTYAEYMAKTGAKPKTDAKAGVSMTDGTRDAAPPVNAIYASTPAAAKGAGGGGGAPDPEKVDGNRRTVLTLASGLLGAVVVAKSSDLFTIGNKAFRPVYAEPLADAAMAKMFPTAMLSTDVDQAVARTLGARGFTPQNTLFSHSVCSDEVNNKEEELVDLMMDRWGEGFSLGGLAGLPFAGKSGFRAYLHHVPDNGKLLIMFAPHVGIDGEGRIGGLQRDGQDAVSKACGAAIGAFKAIKASGAPAPAAPAADPSKSSEAILKIPDPYSDFDPQIQQIVGLLKPRMEGLDESANDIGFVTYQMYGIVRDLIDACVTNTPDVWEWTGEVAIVGGIMINRKNGGDFFQPLSFESRTQAKTTDLYEKTFGKRPDLIPALGTKGVASSIYGSSTLSGLSQALRSELPGL